jgi:hypothetical protein
MAAKDVEVKTLGITPKEHPVRRSSLTGRARYPFKAMIVGDYFLVHTHKDSLYIRNALKSFYKRIQGRRFTVRQKLEDDNVWVCRRVA